MSFSYRHRMARRKYGTPGKRKVHVFGAGKLIMPNGAEYAVTGMEITFTQRPAPDPFGRRKKTNE